MKKSTVVSILALLVAAAGAAIALCAYFSRKKCVLCDDFDDFEDDFSAEEPEPMEYYATEVADDPAQEAAPTGDATASGEDDED